MSLLDRLRPWSTTGVGSLPYTDPQRAAIQAVGSYDLPFCPQLPRLDGDMLAEWLGTDPCRCGWSPGRDRERPRAWEWLLRELAVSPPLHRLVKLQVTGPLTLTYALERAGGRRANDPALRHEVAGWLAANAAAQVAELRERGLEAVLVVDEPSLSTVAGPGIERCWDPLRTVASAWGLHLCCRVPWDVVDEAQPDILSFDLAVETVGGRGGRALGSLMRRGGRVSWGVIPVHREEQLGVASARLESALARSGAVGEQSLLSASCGTGRMSARREATVAASLALLARGRRRQPAHA